MNEFQSVEELARLRIEVEALRLANAALEKQMVFDAEQREVMLRTLESQRNALREAHLRQLNQSSFIQRVMDTTGALVIVLGTEGRVRQINRSCSEELKDTDKPLGDRVLDDWLPPTERQKLSDELASLPWPVHSPFFETVRCRGLYAAEHLLASRDGSYRHYWLEASMQYTPQGQEEGAVICATDITSLKQQQTRLRHSESLLKEAQYIAQLGHWELNLTLDELTWSEEVYRIFELDPGISPSSYAAFLDLVHPDDRAAVDEAYTASLKSRQPYDIKHRLLLADGRVKWVHERALTYYDPEGTPLRSVGTVQDITSQHRLDEQLHLAASVFESSLNGILITNTETRVLKVNQAFSEIMGYSPDEIIGHKTSLIKSGHHDKHFYQTLWATLKQEGKWQGEIWNRRKDGEVIPIWQNISAVRDSKGKVRHYIGVFYDLSEQKQAANRIHYLAYYDTLTNLPNRQQFNERLEQSLERARRENQSVALLFLDLDRFKHVNDSLGHPVGDELLRIVAQRVKETLRHGDTVARLGGDEFIILLENSVSEYDIERVARKILAAVAEPFLVYGHKLDIGTSIGISRYPEDGEDPITLIKHADLAMYQAKEQGRGNFQFYESHLTERAKERLILERELREALKRGELFVCYQPQFALKGDRLIGAEALLRWHHSELGIIPPDKFIPIAEDSGLIIAIGEWVLSTACRQAKALLDAGHDFQHMAVNLSGVQIERSDIFATVSRVLAETGLPPEYLELEITETYIMRQAQRNVRIMNNLRALGVSLAIDDFGTGHSSLSYLKLLPVDKLKIDRSFVMDIPHDSNDIAITRAILALGHSLRLTVLAEGVETSEQAAFLKQLECDEAQGYYYSPPLEAARFQLLFNDKHQSGDYRQKLVCP
jgi:diguanylate cyclase (GGDEF)-like protein/PAS domain S-box-containing protein